MRKQTLEPRKFSGARSGWGQRAMVEVAVSAAPVRKIPEDDSGTWSHRDRSKQSRRNSGLVTRRDAVMVPATSAHPGDMLWCCTSAAPGARTLVSGASLNYLSKPWGCDPRRSILCV